MEIRRLTEHDAQAFWDLRLLALQMEPQAFGESAEEHRQTTVETFAERLRSGNAENFVCGAFVQGRLVGTTGFYREMRMKRRHRGWIWGVFVAPEARGRGASRAMMAHVIETARGIEGLRVICLSAGVGQTSAQALYRSLGFQSIGVERKALMVGDRFYDEEHMHLLL